MLALLLLLLLVRGSAQSLVWRPLSASELQAWYSPVERCMLANNDTAQPTNHLKQRCGDRSRYLGCHVGMGYHGVPCFAPLAGRSGFLSGFEGFTDASARPLERLVHGLVRGNASLVLIGDSLMRQRWQWLECEFKRENAANQVFSVLGSLKEKLPCRTHARLRVHDSTRFVDLFSLALTELRARCGPELGRISHLENTNLIVQQINERNQSALILVNVGLWWSDRKRFADAMPSVAEWLQGLVRMHPRNQVVFVESTAQHWLAPDGSGYYGHGYHAKQHGLEAEAANLSATDAHSWHTKVACRASNLTEALDWRNSIASQALRSAGPRVRFFGLNGTTARLADMHISHPHKVDCTHYCYAPLLWQPLWHLLADAVA